MGIVEAVGLSGRCMRARVQMDIIKQFNRNLKRNNSSDNDQDLNGLGMEIEIQSIHLKASSRVRKNQITKLRVGRDNCWRRTSKFSSNQLKSALNPLTLIYFRSISSYSKLQSTEISPKSVNPAG
ncbi:hypothetical protein Fot_06490 [Forsythia ovata]|uniref:Uncharacterized protein n=1 Tax=Forsythia ovata TaxID=205694 RepID=A0ABD1WT42_9LAMI